MSRHNRRFIRPVTRPSDFPGMEGEVYIVYKYETNKLESDGPYNDSEIASVSMRELLAKGICAWIVSYDA
jgi:hypothetical protein